MVHFWCSFAQNCTKTAPKVHHSFLTWCSFGAVLHKTAPKVHQKCTVSWAGALFFNYAWSCGAIAYALSLPIRAICVQVPLTRSLEPRSLKLCSGPSSWKLGWSHWRLCLLCHPWLHCLIRHQHHKIHKQKGGRRKSRGSQGKGQPHNSCWRMLLGLDQRGQQTPSTMRTQCRMMMMKRVRQRTWMTSIMMMLWRRDHVLLPEVGVIIHTHVWQIQPKTCPICSYNTKDLCVFLTDLFTWWRMIFILLMPCRWMQGSFQGQEVQCHVVLLFTRFQGLVGNSFQGWEDQVDQWGRHQGEREEGFDKWDHG